VGIDGPPVRAVVRVRVHAPSSHFPALRSHSCASNSIVILVPVSGKFVSQADVMKHPWIQCGQKYKEQLDKENAANAAAAAEEAARK